MRGRDVRNVETFHHSRQARQPESVCQRLHVRGWVEHRWQRPAREAARLAGGLPDVFNHVPKLSGFLEIHFRRGFAHLFV